MRYRGQKRRYTPEYARKAWEKLPKGERAAAGLAVSYAIRGLREDARRALDDYAVERYRQSGKAARDLAADGRKRRLVGARVPVEVANMVQIAAADTGRSIYRFVTDAIDAELARANWDGHLFSNK